MADIRSPAVAGMFYPAQAGVLRAEIASYLEAANPPALTSVRAVIVPHAGYMYSCLLYTSPSPRDLSTSRMPSSA